jgi:hypothetical protein
MTFPLLFAWIPLYRRLGYPSVKPQREAFKGDWLLVVRVDFQEFSGKQREEGLHYMGIKLGA